MQTNQTNTDIVSSKRILYTPSAFAKQSLLHVQETGLLQAKHPHTSRRIKLDSLLFFIVISGEGFLDYADETFALTSGDCVFIDCSKPYAHHTSENLWSLQWVHFYGDHATEIYDKYVQRGGACRFSPQDTDIYRNLLTELSIIANGNDSIRDMLLCEKLTSLLTLVMKETCLENTSSSTGRTDALNEIKSYLDAHFIDKISLDELASTFYINKFYLTRIFKNRFGLSVTSYLTEKRITKAKQLLRFSDLSIEEIAVQCGLADANYFARIFKKTEGISPGSFRRNWRS